MRAKRWQILLSGFVCLIITVQVGCLFIPRHITRSDRYEDITILQFNVYYGNRNAGEVGEWIANYSPDIVVLQEVVPDFAAKLAVLDRIYPYHFLNPLEGGFGSVIYSRIPIQEDTREHFSVSGNEYNHIKFHTPAHGLSFGLTELHTMSPVSKQHSEQRNAELKEITVVMNQQPETSRILIGDMNITPYSPWFWELERNTRLNNAMQGRTVTGTWPSFLPALLRIPIDQMLVSDNIGILERQVEQPLGSDHLPVVTKLRIYATD